jgi:hypothetical protein
MTGNNQSNIAICPFCNTAKWPSHQANCPDRPTGPKGGSSPEPHTDAVTGETVISGEESLGPVLDQSNNIPVTAATPEVEKLREQLATIEHERWADWQTWVHKVINEGVEGATLEQFMERWERQINTPYANLSEQEKISDLEQVDRYWPLIERYIATATRIAYERGFKSAYESKPRGKGHR